MIRIFVVFFMLFLTIGCNQNENSQGAKTAPENLPIGYFSNENHEGNNGGNARLLDNDNDGPLIEMLDHSLGNEGQVRKEQRRNNDRFNNAIFNRNGRENHNNKIEISDSYFSDYDGEYSTEISQLAASVVNVADAQAVLYDDTILLAIALEEPARREETEAAIHDVIDEHTKGKNVKIVMDDGMYERLWTIDNVLRQGAPVEEAKKEIKNFIQTQD